MKKKNRQKKIKPVNLRFTSFGATAAFNHLCAEFWSGFPSARTVSLNNNTKIVLKLFRSGPTARLVAFPHPGEFKKSQELVALFRLTDFDASVNLRGAIGYMKGDIVAPAKAILEAKKINFVQPAVFVDTIQMRHPFVALLPNNTRKRFWKFDDALLQEFEAGMKKAGIKSVVVHARDEEKIPPTQKEKLYRQLLESHGYKVVSKEKNETIWLKNI